MRTEVESPYFFSEDFLFGSGTSSYQAERDRRGLSLTDWDLFESAQAFQSAGVGPNWWKLEEFEKDIQLLSQLGLNAQRIGIGWERVVPEKGKIDKSAILGYREMLRIIQASNMVPIVTLYHRQLPQRLAQIGGWENPDTVEDFKYFSEAAADNFGDITHWVTINEPNAAAICGYFLGIFPPAKSNLIGMVRASKGLVRGHETAYDSVKKRIPEAQVGFTQYINWFRPLNPRSLLDQIVTRLSNEILNLGFIRLLKDNTDFIGINMYSGLYAKFNPKAFRSSMNDETLAIPTSSTFCDLVKPDSFESDIGWPIAPAFCLEGMVNIYRLFKKPLFVTENGLADGKDQLRSFYILSHLLALQEALKRGVDIQGYTYWSSIDSWEWMRGLDEKYGLIEVDHKTRERSIKGSAYLLGEIARSRRIEIDDLSERYLTPPQRISLKKTMQDFRLA